MRFKPKTLSFYWFDFSKIEQIKEAGQKSAAGEIANLRALLKK